MAKVAQRIGVAVGAAVVAVSMATPSSSAASYVDKTVRLCTGSSSCGYGLAIDYWYKKGSNSRGVEWVYASKDTKSNKAAYARWLYKKPGGSTHVGKGWRKAKDKGSFMETSWYAGNHQGPRFPKGTVICIQWKGSSKKACATLK